MEFLGKKCFVPLSVIKSYFYWKQEENLPNFKALQGNTKCTKYLHSSSLTGIHLSKCIARSKFKVSKINVTILCKNSPPILLELVP